MDAIVAFLLTLRNRHFLLADALIFLVTPAIALVLRTDGIDDPNYHMSLAVITVVFLLVKLTIFYTGGLYSRFWRYASLDELAHIAILGLVALCFQTLVFFGVLRTADLVSPAFPRSIPIIEGILALIAVGGLRYSVPIAERMANKGSAARRRDGQRVVLVGAGSVGVMIAQEMQSNPKLRMIPVAFVDDSGVKQGMVIRGVPVLGKCSDIATVCEETGADQVIIAMPKAPGKVIREIVGICERAGVHTKIIPGMYELLDGTVSARHLRDVAIEDLLRREPIHTDISAVSELLHGKRVLITGGGGSIGSELCRQVLRFQPESLIILGHGENSVFEIHNELTRLLEHGLPGIGSPGQNGHTGLHTQIFSVIADIRFTDRIRSVFEEHQPDVVFHSAAHKHVPLMEMNPAEAITNNVLGTRNVLEASLDVGVEHFVMISTDKAVNPTSIMGASKRAAEFLVHKVAEQSGKPFVAVRFGNVLGSRGSAVLTFKQQIAAGGPVTVTHPDMVRYFMTIPEAVQLVLQAAPLGRGGEVFMLDMGEPIKIVDLAKDLIELSGLEVGVDIDIVFTGTRPGEKLFEELFVEGERYERTRHEKIFLADNASSFVPAWLDLAVAELEMQSERNDNHAIVHTLRILIPEFQPAGRVARAGAETEAEIEAEVARAIDRTGIAIAQKRDQQTDIRDKGDGEIGSLGGEIGSLGAAAG